MKEKERRRRAIAAGLNPDTATEKEILEAEAGKKNIVNTNEKEEDTKRIFNLATPPTEKTQTPNRQIETNPVKAWGKK